MSGIIKSALAAERVRAVLNGEAAARPPAELEIDPDLADAQAEIACLSGLLRARDVEIEELKQAVDDARRSGEALGRTAGLAEGSQYAEQAIDALTEGVSRACDELGGDIESLERLALLVAQAALEQVLGPDADQKRLVAQIIARQVELLGAEAILMVEVPSKDFAHSDLAGLRAPTGGIEIKASDDIVKGGCRIKLRLGSLEVGPQQQWSALRAELSEMAASVSP
jgi:flagellar biosynthesis/type III secretory pathway protein FliH